MSAHRGIRPWLMIAGLLVLATRSTTADGGGSADQDRYAARDPLSLTVSRRPVMRGDYVETVRPWAEDYQMTPEADQWGWRHGPLRIMPPLAVFALEGDRQLGEKIKRDLRAFAHWVDDSVATKGVVFSLDAMTLSVLCFTELRNRHLMDADDERWAKELVLNLCRYHPAWAEGGPWDGWFRGSQHRAQAQGVNQLIAAFLYPDEPDAGQWNRIGNTIWGDWWDFRDVGINDLWYFHSSLGNITRAAHVLGREEVFTDPQARDIFERILFETSPEGNAIPYGASCGFNVVAGSRIVALELAARHTRDGRYRWGAERLMNNLQARPVHANSLQGTKAIADLAVASLICDDSIEPVRPEPNSRLLTRKEITRGGVTFPGFSGVDCDMYMTQRVMPSKLTFRSGWEPGDLFMLVECYARHDPLNPTAIIGLERFGASMAEMVSEKFICRENAVAIHDLSGTATYLGNREYRGPKNLPLGWAGMESTVPVFSDHALATHARIDVSGYLGFEATHCRELLFVKNGFVLVRDETVFDDAFQAEIGPVWNTQEVAEIRGTNWMNTWFSGHYFDGTKLCEVPPWDLLVWYAPREETQLSVLPDEADAAQRGAGLIPTRYSWRGDVAPRERFQFTTLLLPHAPTRDAGALAAGIRALADEPGLAAVQLRRAGRCELALLNTGGRPIELDADEAGRVATDGHAAYVDLNGGKPRRAVLVQGTFLRVGEQDLFRGVGREDFELID